MRYTINSNGKFKCESKDSVKKRGLRSPDLGDSFILTFGGQGARASGAYSGYSFKKEIEYDTSWVV